MLTDELKFQEGRKEGGDDVEVMAPDSNIDTMHFNQFI